MLCTEYFKGIIYMPTWRSGSIDNAHLVSWFGEELFQRCGVHAEYEDCINSLSILIRVNCQRTLADWTKVLDESPLSFGEIEEEFAVKKNRFVLSNCFTVVGHWRKHVFALT
jgi:hypothetical protein